MRNDETQTREKTPRNETPPRRSQTDRNRKSAGRNSKAKIQEKSRADGILAAVSGGQRGRTASPRARGTRAPQTGKSGPTRNPLTLEVYKAYEHGMLTNPMYVLGKILLAVHRLSPHLRQVTLLRAEILTRSYMPDELIGPKQRTKISKLLETAGRWNGYRRGIGIAFWLTRSRERIGWCIRLHKKGEPTAQGRSGTLFEAAHDVATAAAHAKAAARRTETK